MVQIYGGGICPAVADDEGGGRCRHSERDVLLFFKCIHACSGTNPVTPYVRPHRSMSDTDPSLFPLCNA